MITRIIMLEYEEHRLFFGLSRGTLSSMIKFISYVIAFLFLLTAPLMAQQSVNVRTGVHKDYLRLVFDFDTAPSYQVSDRDTGEVRISFDVNAPVQVVDTNYKKISYVSDIRVDGVSQNDGKVVVYIDVPLKVSYRNFSIGSKVVVDIYSPSSKELEAIKSASQNASSDDVEAPAEKSDEKSTADITTDTDNGATDHSDVQKAHPRDLILDTSDPEAVKKLLGLVGEIENTMLKEVEGEQGGETAALHGTQGHEDAAHDDASHQNSKAEPEDEPEDEKDQADQKTILERETPDVSSHILSVTLTEVVGLAVFERAGWLWVVMDRPNVDVPPKIAGPDAASFNKFIKQDVEGGVAFRMLLPKDDKLKFYGDGGGLLWRVILTEKQRETTPVNVQRSFLKNDSVRGGVMTWKFLNATKVLKVPDPNVGDVLDVVTLERAGETSGMSYDQVDFDVMRSFIGLAIQPNVDDLDVSVTAAGVAVSRPGGLALSRRRDVNRRLMREEVQDVSYGDTAAQQRKQQKDIVRIFDFDRWVLGGLKALEENQRILMATIPNKDDTGKVQDLLTLAKMNLANDRGQEALGFLTLAGDVMPEIKESVEYRALLGGSYALAGKHRSAFRYLFDEDLDQYTEINYWRAYTLAWLEDWDQAGDVIPTDFSVLIHYPRALLEKIGVKTAEIALRNGYIADAESILYTLAKEDRHLADSTQAAIKYLKGVAHNINGEYDSAEELWKPLIAGKDDFFRARAGLALTLQELQLGKISQEDAIDRLEGLRYAWRGDELEASINFLLGKQYIEKDMYVRGFDLLRDSASLRPDTDVSRDITDYMRETFKDIILNEEDLSPFDAAKIYDEFRELTPSGDGALAVIRKLADRLVEADLLGRAADLLQKQVDFRLEGIEKAETAERLATIYLLDNKPTEAMELLKTAQAIYASSLIKDQDKDRKLLRISLLTARSLSQLDKPEEALDLLDALGTASIVSRLRADIAWQSGLWDEASDAIQNLIIDENINQDIPLSDRQAGLVLNRAVALNLAGDRVGLAAMRTQYTAAMDATNKGRLFEVVTRPRQTSIIADQKTILSLVEEVDLFKEFLDNYNSGFDE